MVSRNVSSNVCCAGTDLITPPAPPPLTSSSSEGGVTSVYSRCGKVGKVMYSVGAVFAAYEFYHSLTQAKEFSRRLQRLRDAAEVYKYEGAAKEVFNICLDLQALLTIFNSVEEEYEVLS